jgi:hypothetical protein
LRLLQRAPTSGGFRIFDRKKWEIEADAIDELVADPELDCEAPHFSRRDERLRELEQAHALDPQRSRFVRERVFDLVGAAERLGIRRRVIRRRRRWLRRRHRGRTHGWIGRGGTVAFAFGDVHGEHDAWCGLVRFGSARAAASQRERQDGAR